jgi:hypothetical protein
MSAFGIASDTPNQLPDFYFIRLASRSVRFWCFDCLLLDFFQNVRAVSLQQRLLFLRNKAVRYRNIEAGQTGKSRCSIKRGCAGVQWVGEVKKVIRIVSHSRECSLQHRKFLCDAG